MLDNFSDWINRLMYNACEGRPSEIKALEKNTYLDFCMILDKYLEKVKAHNKQVEKLNNKHNG